MRGTITLVITLHCLDTGKDSGVGAQWNVYGTAAYGGIGYLNTDWAYHYFRWFYASRSY
ncbi:hypothetical protein O9992_29965 [Vibrio lentus]|nr:hypothetical protein [Vibrio lentus]